MKGRPTLDTSVGAGADPGLDSSQPTGDGHKPGGRLLFLSDWPAVTSPDADHHPVPNYILLGDRSTFAGTAGSGICDLDGESNTLTIHHHAAQTNK